MPERIPPRARLAQRQLSRLLRQRRGRVTLRFITRGIGAAPANNPPALASVVVDGDHAAGETTLRLRGATLRGRFILGDMVQIGGIIVAVSAVGAADDGQNRITLPLTAPLGTALVDGAAATGFVWSADKLMPAEIAPYPRSLIDGQMVLAGDLQVTVSAYDCPKKPRPQDMLLVSLDGDEARPYAIQSVTPRVEQGWVVAWVIQGRGG